MGKPVNHQSVSAQTATGAGTGIRTRGQYHTTLIVAATALDSANDSLEVHLEVSADGDHWASLGSVTAADFATDPTSGVPTAALRLNGAYAEYARARVASYTDAAGGDLAVDAWVQVSGWEGPGVRSGRES